MAVDPVRSRIMRAVRRTNTGPELIVRQILHRLGLRFRLHRTDLAGSPDVVLPKHRSVVFVHGCFWHRHAECRKATTPKTRIDFWREKFDANVARDARNEEQLRLDGWEVLTIWECETERQPELETRLRRVFGTALD